MYRLVYSCFCLHVGFHRFSDDLVQLSESTLTTTKHIPELLQRFVIRKYMKTHQLIEINDVRSIAEVCYHKMMYLH